MTLHHLGNRLLVVPLDLEIGHLAIALRGLDPGVSQEILDRPRSASALSSWEKQKRLQDPENQALRWTKASQLRTYIAEVEKKASGSDLPTEEQERLANWLRRVREHADRIDPLIGDAWKGPSIPKES
jgi:hypothetical protein